MLPLKYLSKFWRNLAMSLINCDFNVILACFGNFFAASNALADQAATSATIQNKIFGSGMTALII